MCVTNGKKYYQFTAVDECTRWTYREMYDEHSTFSAKCFLENLIRKAPFPIREVQTDNGTEFTNALLVTKSKHRTMFEQALLEMGIEYHRIQIATPRHNGKCVASPQRLLLFNRHGNRHRWRRTARTSLGCTRSYCGCAGQSIHYQDCVNAA